MASEYGLEILVTPIADSAAAAAMGSKTAQSFNQGFERSLSKQPLGRITGQASEFQKSIEASNARVIAFGASAGSIYLVKVALDKLVSSTVQVEKGLANINVILGLGQTVLRSFSNEMFKAAANTGQTFETASKVALEFARHGVSATETVKRMTSAMELMRISGLSAEDSVNSITAAINAFNKEGLTSEDIVNRLTAVDTKFAVSAQDLAESIRRVGATAEDAGVRFNELLGFVTAAQTVTARGGAVIGNAFKSIFTRLARPQVLDDLEAVGVATRTTSGQILPMVTILKGLASTYDSLSYSQKSFITQAVGGVYQVNILKASLADLGNGMSIFDKASIAASQSAGLIDKRMSSLNETLSSKVNASMLEITKLFSNFGNIAFGSSAKSGVDNFNQQLASISDKLEDIKPDDSIGERMGKTLGQGISRGIGDILSGPVVQMVAALGTKAMITLGSFAQKSGKEFLGKNSDAEKLAYIQKDITKFIKENKDAQALFNSELDKSVEISKLYLQTLSKGRIFDEKSKNVSRSVANIVQGSMSATPITRASGYVPSFAAHQEVSQARALGAPASVQAQWGRGTIGGQSFVMNNRELEIPHFGTNGDSAVLPTYSRGFVPNFAHIPLLTPLVGRFLTNTIHPYSYALSPKLNELSQLSGKDIFNALVRDRPSPQVQYSFRMAGEGGRVRDFAFRKMFGLKQRTDVSDIISQNKDKTYSFQKGSELYDEISFDSCSRGLGKFLGKDHSVMNMYDAFQHQNGDISYKDTWDIGLNAGEKVDYGGAFKSLLNLRHLKKLTHQQEGMYPGVTMDKYSPLSNLLRKSLNAITSPITFAGRTGNGVGYAGGNLNFESSLGKFGITQIRGYLGKQRVGDLEYSEDNEKAKEIEYFGIDKKHQGQGYAKQFYQAMGPGKAHGIILPNFDKQGNVFFPQLSRAAVAKDASIVYHGVFSKPDPQPRKNYTIDEFKKLISERQKDQKFWKDEGQSFELITNHAKGFVPNFAMTGLEVQNKRNKRIAQMMNGTFQQVHQAGEEMEFISGDYLKNKLESYQGTKVLGSFSTNRLPGGRSFEGYDLITKMVTQNPELASKLGINAGEISRVLTQVKGGTRLNLREAEIETKMANAREWLSKVGKRPVASLLAVRAGQKPMWLKHGQWLAEGFIPNFGVGDDRFNQMGQFLMRGVKKPLPTLSKNDYADYTSYLGGVSAAQLDKDMKDGYFGGAFDIGRKKTSSLHRLLKKKGFSFSALQNAIGREVSAGYSPEQVLIGESSSLVSSHNPSGVGVYNSTEGSLDRGISLAQQAGVDPSTKGTAGGYVPNFAGVESSWLMGMIQGSVTDLSKRLNFLSVGYDKEIEARRKLAEEYSKAVSQVKAGQSAITPLGTFTDEKNLKQAYYSKYRDPTPESPRGGKYLFQKRESERETKRYDQYYQEKQASQKKLSDLGFKGMFAGPMIGEGIASVFKTAGMENVSKGFQEFSGGITTASQMLNLFPDKLGKALAVGEIVKSFGNAIAAATSKVGTYEKQLDIQSTILEKLGSASSVMLDSYDKLNQIYNSSTSTMQDFLVQQQRLAKSLMELADVTGGGQLIHDLRGAGTSQQRQTAVTKAMEEAQSLKNIDSVKLEIAQSKQSSWNTASAFSYANDADKINKTQLLRTASYTMQGSALDNLKNKDLNQRLITGSINDQDISIIVGKAADQNKNVLGLNSNDLEQALKELEWQLNQIKMPTNYEGGMEAWTKHLQELFQSTQEEISLRNKYNQELQSALAQGAIISSYNLKQGTQGVESRYREQSLGLAKGAEQVRLKGLTTNDYGMINIEAAQKREEIKAKNQYEQKLNINKGDIEVNTMMSGVIGKALERLKTPNPEGVVNNISVAQQEMSNFLNPKLQNLSRPENAGQLFKMAQNPDTFADKVLGNKTEAITQNSFNQLKTELTTMGRSPDLLAKIADILDKQLNLTSDVKKALDELDVHTQAALKEMNFKDLSNALGGQDILKRGHAREMRRRIVKDEYVMNHSTNAIARGGAAADEASLILPEDRKGPLWDKIKKNMQQGLMSADTFALRGTELGQTQSFQNTQAVAFAQNYGNNKGVEGAPKGKGPENVSLTPGVSELDEAADKAAIDVSAFGKALASLGNLDTLKAFAAQLEAIQNRIASLNPPTTPGTSPKEPVVPPQNFWQRHLPSMTDVTSAVITGATMGAVGPIAGKLGGLGKRLLGGAKTKVSEMHLPGYQAAKRLLDREGAGTPSQSELNFENSPKPQNTQTGLSPEEEAKYLKDRAKNYRTTPLSKERMQLEIEPGLGPKLEIPKPSLTSKFADMGKNFGKSMIPGVSEAKGLDMLKLTEGAKMGGLFTAVTGLVDIGSTVAGGLSAKGHGSINDILGDEMALQQQSYGGTGQHPILGKTLGNTLDYVGTMFSPQDWAMRIAQWTSPKGKSLADAQDMSVQNNVAEQQARASYIQKKIQSLGGHVKINELMGQGNYRDIFNPEWQKAHGLTTEEKPATPQTSTEAPKNEAKLLPDTIKIENGTMTIVLDLSKARQQIQGMITASLDRIGKSNPPLVATAYTV